MQCENLYRSHSTPLRQHEATSWYSNKVTAICMWIFEALNWLVMIISEFILTPPTCSRTENHLWRGTHRNVRSSDLLFYSLECTPRAWTKLQSWPRRPARLLSPKHTINWAVKRQRGTVCSSLTSTSCRCVCVATSDKWRLNTPEDVESSCRQSGSLLP